jgi:RNA polymerase sigma factor (sigma-70 family)
MSLVTVKKKSVSVSNVDCAAEIYSKHGEFILSVIRYHAGNNNEAGDLFQDFFLYLVSKPIPPNVRNVRGYLYRAITSEIIDASRRVKSYQARMEKYARNLNYSINKNSPENVLIEFEEINKMFKLIEGQLPHSEAQAVTLRYKSDRSIREVAREMCVNDRTVSRYISAGLSKFRQFLAEKRR